MRRTIRVASAAALFVAGSWSAPVDAGPSGGALPPELVEVIDPSDFGVPLDAEMAAVNLTAVTPRGSGHLTVYPCDEELPETSNLNYSANSVVPNLVFARLAGDGTFCIATWDVTDLVVDIVGYVPAGSSIEALTSPERALDTRTGSAGETPIPAGRTVVVPIADRLGVAADATSAFVNLTAAGGQANGFLTLYPCDGGMPGTSSVNFLAGTTVANAAITRLSANGSVCIHASAAVDIVLDVVAFQRTASGVQMLSTPERMVDTRRGPGLPQPADGTLHAPVAERHDVPDDATAAIYNLTSDQAVAPGFATSFPCDSARPLASNLNYVAGVPTANSAMTKLAADGTLCVYTLAATHLIVDLVGYVQGESDYIPIDPVRARDTRLDWWGCNTMLMRSSAGSWAVRYPDSGRVTLIDLPPSTRTAVLAPDCTYAVGRDLEGRTWSAPADGSRATLLSDEPNKFFDVVGVLADGTVLVKQHEALWTLESMSGTVQGVPWAVIPNSFHGALLWVSDDGRFVSYRTSDLRTLRRFDRDTATWTELPLTVGFADVTDDGLLVLNIYTDSPRDSFVTTFEGTRISGTSVPWGCLRWSGGTSVWCIDAKHSMFGGEAVRFAALDPDVITQGFQIIDQR